MGASLRRLLSFDCQNATCGASLDDAPGGIGLLIVTGGSQTRIGSHRMSERLATSMAAAGIAVFRFDRRGVGDSDGVDPGYRASGDDLSAATAAFRRAAPRARRLIGLGLCDGASALALFGADAGLDGLILINPWLAESADGAPAPEAIKAHYRARLLSREGWRKLLGGDVSYRKLLAGIGKIASAPPADLADEIADALDRKPLPLALILARGDMTAMAAGSLWAGKRFGKARARAGDPIVIETDSHTFARPGDDTSLQAAVLAAILRVAPSP